MGYCGVHSAEFGPVWTGDLGRSGAAAPTALRHGAPTRGVLGERAQIGLACAAGRVNVSGLDSWLALVEQPPRTDEAPETQDIARTFPRGSPRRSRRQGNRIEPRTLVCSDVAAVPSPICPRCLVDGAVLVLPVRVRAASALSAPASRVARSRQRRRRAASAASVREDRGRAHASPCGRLRRSALSEVPAAQREEVRCPDRAPTSRRGRRESNVPTNTSTPR